MLIVILKSLVIGALAGFAVSAGAARMFHAPETPAMGAFRTLGELNACKGDAVAHFRRCSAAEKQEGGRHPV